jgi:DNA-binding MarR family transcriptional regulator
MPTPERLRTIPTWLLSQAALRGRDLVAERLATEGVRRPHFSVLVSLADDGPASQAELGRRVWIDRSDMVAVLNDLERAGLVERARDEQDRRRNVITLTAKGRRARERLERRVAEAQDALLDPLAPDERAQLLALLTRVVEHHRR